MGWNLAVWGRSTLGQPIPGKTRAGWRFKPCRQLGPAGQPAREAEEVSGDVGRPIKSTSMADSRLRPLATRSREETLARPGGDDGSPGGLPRRQEGDRAARRVVASSSMVGMAGKGAGRRICMKAVASSTSGLQGPRLRHPRVKQKGRVS
jgi:hypothetical protein